MDAVASGRPGDVAPDTPDMLVCGIDLGTTKCAAALVRTGDGATVEESSVPHEAGVTGLPPGRAEQAPARILAAAAEAVQALNPALRRRVAAVGVTGQMHGVLLARDGEPVSTLITWQDARCTPPFIERLRRLTGRADVQTGYGAATLAWLAENSHLPPADAAAAAACTIHDLLVWHMTGRSRPCTDPTDAASWGWFDGERNAWVQDAWRQVGVPVQMLPEIVPSGALAGRLTGDAARTFGLPEGVPVAAAIGDNQASVLAALRGEVPGQTLVLTLGTGAQLSAVLTAHDAVPSVPPGGPLEIRPFPDQRILLAAAALCGGSAMAWLVDTIREWCHALGGTPPSPDQMYARLDKAGMDAEGGGLEWIPRFLGERGSPGDRAVLRGMTFENVTPGNATLALARGVVANLAGMFPKDVLNSRRRVVGTGNALRRLAVMRRAAEEVLDLPLKLSAGGEEAAAGAAMLAARLTVRGR